MKDRNISRRNFLKYMAGGSAAIVPGAALLSGCKRGSATVDSADGSAMTMRVNPNTGDKVSLLGYGMMRLPTLPEGSEEDPQTGRMVSTISTPAPCIAVASRSVAQVSP